MFSQRDLLYSRSFKTAFKLSESLVFCTLDEYDTVVFV